MVGSTVVRRTLIALAAGVFAVSLPTLSACGGAGPEEVDRSMREFQLAASLREEGDVPGSLSHLRRSLELDPENPRAHLLLGYIYLERQEFETAETHLREGLALVEERPDLGSTKPEAQNVLGVTLIHQERYDEAIELLTASAEDALNTAPWYAYGNLGWAQYEKGDYEASLLPLRRSVDVQPRFCLGFFLLGRSLVALERFEEAEEALSGAVTADERCGQGYQEAYRLRGETRSRLGRRAEALADFERCVEMGDRTEAGSACTRFLATVSSPPQSSTDFVEPGTSRDGTSSEDSSSNTSSSDGGGEWVTP